MDQFEEEKARLVALYGGAARDAPGKRAQAFARLYAQSGWTERALAEVEKMSQSKMHCWLVFGRFLITNCNQSSTCSEGRFRALWARTDKTATEAARFAAVEELLQEDTTDNPSIKGFGKKMIAQFADGKWHRLPEIAEAMKVDIALIQPVLDRIVSTGAYKTFAERRPGGKGSFSYRLIKGGKKKIDMIVFEQETREVLAEMATIINGHPVHFLQQNMKVAFTHLCQAIERLGR